MSRLDKTRPSRAGLPGVLASLDRLRRSGAPEERCDLCAAALGEDHSHLVEPARRRLVCACEPCTILFGHGADQKYRQVPRRVRRLANFHLEPGQWEAFGLPVRLAFFLNSTTAGRMVVVYPSPGGALEAPLEPEAWNAVAAQNPGLETLEPDVEALLVNRVGAAREHFRVGIDACYRLVGLLRMHWQGFSGGEALWEEIRRFFARLGERAHD